VCERVDDTVAPRRVSYGDAVRNPNRTFGKHIHVSLLPLQDDDEESGDDGGSGVDGCSRVI